MDAAGISFLREGELRRIDWSDVVVAIDEETEPSTSLIPSLDYKIKRASDPDWEFTLRDSMMNYHAARLLLQRKGLIAE